MRTALLYAQVTVLTGVVLVFAFDLSRANLRIPFYYSVGGGDLYFFLTMDKTIAETGWYTENPRLGAPGVMKLYDFPGNDTGLMLGVKLLIALVGDTFLAANLYFLMTFFTAAIASLFVLRAFGAHGQVAVAASLLFAFLPYHFWRGPFHPHYSTYHAIPLVAMVALWLCGTEPLLFRRDESGRLRWAWSLRRTLPAAVACVLTSVSGPYYAFFGTFLILAGGLIGLLRKPGVDRVLDALAAAGLVAGLFTAQLIPNALDAVREGPNPLPWKRPVGSYYRPTACGSSTCCGRWQATVSRGLTSAFRSSAPSLPPTSPGCATRPTRPRSTRPWARSARSGSSRSSPSASPRPPR